MMDFEDWEISSPLPERLCSKIPMKKLNNSLRAGVHEVTSQEFDIYEKKDEVLFLYFYDQATTSEDFVLNFADFR